MSIKKFLVAAAVIAGSSSAALARPYRQETNRHEAYRQQANRQQANRHDAYRHEAYRHDASRRPWMAQRYFAQPRVNVYRPYRYYATPTYVAPTYVTPTYVAPQTYMPQTYAATAFINGQSYIALAGYGRGIQLQMTDGPAFVDRIEIHYADGRTQMVHVDARLDATNPVFDVPVDGYGVTGVTLFGEGAGVSAIAVQ